MRFSRFYGDFGYWDTVRGRGYRTIAFDSLYLLPFQGVCDKSTTKFVDFEPSGVLCLVSIRENH